MIYQKIINIYSKKMYKLMDNSDKNVEETQNNNVNNFFSNKFRIVSDNYNGYEVQIKKWWFPFYVQCWEDGYHTNTFSSIDEAKEWVKTGWGKRTEKSKVVEYL